ncbi:MAG TPA: c-type cytochrome domain-containing protein [Fimbriimonadales bacterium]|nr:c-type cytochrome domain-containing protein [Fimbriimonadales bacterium]
MSRTRTFKFSKTIITLIVLGFIFAISSGISVNAFEKSEDDTGDYEKIPTWKEVAGILKKECITCHSAKIKTANLDLSSYQAMMRGGRSGAIVVPRNPKASLIMKYIKGDKKPRMPMGGKPLKQPEIKLIERWIASGAQEK